MTDAPSMDEIRTFSPQQATEALAGMTASNPAPALVPQKDAAAQLVPANAHEERAHLDALSRDAGWANAFWAGDRAARAQFDRLVELKANVDPVADAIAGVVEPQQIFETTTSGQFPSRAVKAVVDDMRLYNISDGAIKETLDNTPVAAREYAATVALKTQKFGDPEWTARLLRGEWSATREWKLMTSILSRPIAE